MLTNGPMDEYLVINKPLTYTVLPTTVESSQRGPSYQTLSDKLRITKPQFKHGISSKKIFLVRKVISESIYCDLEVS